MLRYGWGLGRQIAGLLRRPVLFLEAVRAFWAFRAHGRVLPSSDYLHWRFHTAYGDDMSAVDDDDLARFLSWRRTMRLVA